MQDEINIISLDDIMMKIRKSELIKIIYGTYAVPSSLSDIKIDDIKLSKQIEIGECYIKDLGKYNTEKLGNPLSVNIDTLINKSNYEQHLSSSAANIAYSRSKTTQLSAGIDIGKKVSLQTKIFNDALSEENVLTFHVNSSTSHTETQTITKTIPSQTIIVPPKSCAHVKAFMTNIEIIGEVMICVGLSRYEEGKAHITKPRQKHIEYEIDMLSHIATSPSTPFPFDTRLKPITFKELKKGHSDPVELWTTGEYKIDSATMSTISVDISPIGSDEIVNSYSIEL